MTYAARLEGPDGSTFVAGHSSGDQMSKSVEAFRTIAEVADELRVPKHVLRFWEVKFPQIRPMKRGGGRRFYRPEDLELLRGIQALLHAEAYTIKGVQKILREQGVEHVKKFGRDPLSIPSAANGRRGRRSSADKARAGSAGASSAGATPPPASSKPPSRAAAARTAAARRQRIEAVIAELEACRALLEGGGARAGAAGRSRDGR